MTSWTKSRTTSVRRSPVLLLGSDTPIQHALAQELEALPASTVRATNFEAASAHEYRFDGVPRVLLLPEEEIQTRSFEQQLAELRIRIGSPRLIPIAYGNAPSEIRRRELRDAGIELALFGRFGRHALRFQINRALSPWVGRRPRGELRAPQEWRTRIFSSGKEKSVRCYSLSSAGAYFVTPRPWVVGSDVSLELPMGRERKRVEGRILYTNQLGPNGESALPRGMAISFRPLSGHLQRVIRAGVSRSQARLEV